MKSRFGGGAYAVSEMIDHPALLREFYAHIVDTAEAFSPIFETKGPSMEGTRRDIFLEFNEAEITGGWIMLPGNRDPEIQRMVSPT